MLVFISPEDADKVLDKMKQNRYGKESVIIGEVGEASTPYHVFMKTPLGAHRIVDMLTGELLPRNLLETIHLRPLIKYNISLFN